MKVRSMRGREIDMNRFIITHGDRPALGNAKRNARGDKIGPGGQVVEKREGDRTAYNRANPKSVKSVGINSLASEVFATPAEAVRVQKERAAAHAAAAQAQADAAAKIEAEANPRSKRKLTD